MSGERNHCTFTVAAEGEHSWSSRMEDRFQQEPTLLRPSTGTYSCFIFRAPKSQVESNPNAYKPHIVSIGPYHHGKQQLKMIEQHKTRVFSILLDRTSDDGAGLDDYFTAVASLETDIRDSYSEALNCETADLIEMMVLDACFIIELFRVHTVPTKIPQYDEDPLLFTPGIVAALMIDLLLIENQIPFFVLQEIYELSRSPYDGDRSIDEIALMFFNCALQWPEQHLPRHVGSPKITHLLDLFRLCLVGLSIPTRPPPVDEELLQPIPSVNQLLVMGINFEPMKSQNLINVMFDHGVLRIPSLTLDHFSVSFFLNCVAYEQCYHYCGKHISSYVVLMKLLMSTAADVEVLSQRSIIKNFLGTNEEVARLFNHLAKDFLFDVELDYLTEIYKQVTLYRRNKWRMWWAGVWWAGIKREYFSSRWSFILVTAAITLLVLTIIQAFFTIYPYYHPKK